MISVATWNINSVRLRMPLVERYLAEHAPDVLCLQEIKTVAELFPAGLCRSGLHLSGGARAEGLSRRGDRRAFPLPR
jgi:exonuclease III